MSRTEKLYARLARLEEEYLRLIRKEFQGQSDGLSTPWLNHRKAYLPMNRTNQAKVQHVDKLERDIVAIRRRLKEAIPGHAVAVPQEVLDNFDALGVLQDHGDWLRLVRDALSRIDAIRNPRSTSAQH